MKIYTREELERMSQAELMLIIEVLSSAIDAAKKDLERSKRKQERLTELLG